MVALCYITANMSQTIVGCNSAGDDQLERSSPIHPALNPGAYFELVIVDQKERSTLAELHIK